MCYSASVSYQLNLQGIFASCKHESIESICISEFFVIADHAILWFLGHDVILKYNVVFSERGWS